MKKTVLFICLVSLFECVNPTKNTEKQNVSNKDTTLINPKPKVLPIKEEVKETKVEKIKAEEKVEVRNINTENCYCCNKPYEAGKGFFYYKEAGHWYFYEQSQDLLEVAIGKYSCSRSCAKECPVRSTSSYY